jgi:enterochelin esterase-like enzyme
MKKLTILISIVLTVNLISAQINICDTSFFSEALEETKMVDVFLPPGYNDNPNMEYPVIYLLHGWGGDQNAGNIFMNDAYSLINSGLIDPVIMVSADNSPEPFGGSYYVNSVLWGDYETYMVNDLTNWIESTYRAKPNRNYRALLGGSMGGYGAFRYGILYQEQYCAIASLSGIINFGDDFVFTNTVQGILEENTGPPYFFDYYTSGNVTRGQFLLCGAFSPNLNSPQTWINPAIVEFSIDESGTPIDTIIEKFNDNDIAYMINQLTPDDSLGIYFVIGTQDEWFLYPGTLAVKDSLDLYDIPYEFHEFIGGHTPPSQYRIEALEFLDSLLYSPIIASIHTLEPSNKLQLNICPNPTTEIANIHYEFDSEQEVELSVQSINGQTIKHVSLGKKKIGLFKLNCEEFSPGIYFITLKSESGISTEKLIIE